MHLRAVGYSDRGPVRPANEDHYGIGPFVEQAAFTVLALDVASVTFREYGLLVAVADGLGGYAGGEVASRVALETLSALFYGERRAGISTEQFTEQLRHYLEQTQRALEAVLRRSPEYLDAGTTLAGIALLPPETLVIFHAGDSRVLRAAAGYVRPLTVDHTVAGADLASGRMSEAEAAAIPQAGLLTRALGLHGDTRVEIDATQTWAPGTLFLLGSDGWHGTGRGISRQAIQAAVREGLPVEVLVRRLIGEAIAADGHDNATLVVVAIEEDHEQTHG